MKDKKLLKIIIILLSFILIVAFCTVLIIINNNKSKTGFFDLPYYENYSSRCTENPNSISKLLSTNLPNGIIINSEEELDNHISECENIYNPKILDTVDSIDENYWDNGSLIVYMYYDNSHIDNIKVTNVNCSSDKKAMIDIAVNKEPSSSNSANSEILYILTSKLKNNAKLKFHINKYSDDSGPLLFPEGVSSGSGGVDKPVIYLYPEQETQLTVKLGKPDLLTCVYPEYKDCWNVTAYPNGTLLETSTNREYYSLYYEAINTKDYSNDFSEGFVISKNDITKFLEEKLAILGLNERESEEFIIYWLPKLQQYNYIYIRFQTLEEIEDNMPLYISQNPDTLIRVMMEWKGLDKHIDVEEQVLTTVSRNGFTVVEWGGTQIQ